MSVSYIITDNTVTLNYSNGDVDSIPIRKAEQVLQALKKGLPEADVREYANRSKMIAKYMNGCVAVERGRVTYNGEELHGVLVDKILEFADNGYPYESLVAFLGRLMKNPSNRAVQELYGFLANEGLAITDEGKFRAYKAIRNNWTDKHSGRFDNHVGNVLEMPRNSVDDNCNNGCSHGFHVGSLTYVDHFKSGDDRVVIVEVDPADVVSVPVEDCGKVRVCKYKVVGEYTGPLPSYVHDEEKKPCDEPRRKYPEGELKSDYVEECPLDQGDDIADDDPTNCPHYDTRRCPYVTCRLEIGDEPEDPEDPEDDAPDGGDWCPQAAGCPQDAGCARDMSSVVQGGTLYKDGNVEVSHDGNRVNITINQH